MLRSVSPCQDPASAYGHQDHRQPSSGPSQPVPILMYHSISDQAATTFRPWAVSPAVFDTHMAHLAAGGYTALTVAQLTKLHLSGGRSLPPRPVVLTFDDGFADFFDAALPILRRYGLASTLYLTTAYVGATSRWLAWEGEGQRRMLTWSQVRELAAAGVEIGAHSHRHPQLDTLTARAAWDEIYGSKAIIEDQLGQAVDTFAYPHGYYSHSTRHLVQEAGYIAACGVKHAMSRLDDDRYALARIIVTPDVDVRRLDDQLNGVDLPRAPKRERLRTTGWRMARSTAALLRAPAFGWRPLDAGGASVGGELPAARKFARAQQASRQAEAVVVAQALCDAAVSPRLRPVIHTVRHAMLGRAAVGQARELAPAILAQLSDTQLSDVSGLDRASGPPVAEWDVLRAEYTESDLVVMMIGPRNGAPQLVAKVAASPAATDIVRQQVEALARLSADPALTEWRRLAPSLVWEGVTNGARYLVETVLPGRTPQSALRDPVRCTRIQTGALNAIGELHRRSVRPCVVEPPQLARWIDGPAAILHAAIGRDRRLERMTDELRSTLDGMAVHVTAIHGDLWPGNLLIDPITTAVTGIVDWDLAAVDELPLHDVLNLLLSTQELTQGQALGTLVGARLDGRGWSCFERLVLDTHARSSVASPLPERTMLLLYWLRYVATYLQKSPQIVRNGWWMGRNVERVLEVAGTERG